MKPFRFLLVFFLSAHAWGAETFVCEKDLAVLGRLGKLEKDYAPKLVIHQNAIHVEVGRNLLNYPLPNRYELKEGVDFSYRQDGRGLVVPREGEKEIEYRRLSPSEVREVFEQENQDEKKIKEKTLAKTVRPGEDVKRVYTGDKKYPYFVANAKVSLHRGPYWDKEQRIFTPNRDNHPGPHIELMELSFPGSNQKQIATSNEYGQVHLYDLPQNPYQSTYPKPIEVKGLRERNTKLAYSPGVDPQLAILSGGHVYINLGENEVIPLAVERNYTQMRWLNASTLALASEDGPIEYWAVKFSDGKQEHFKTWKGHEGSVKQMELVRDANARSALVTLGTDGTLRAAPVETFKRSRTLTNSQP